MCQGVDASVSWVSVGMAVPLCDAAGADQSNKNNNKKKQVKMRLFSRSAQKDATRAGYVLPDATKAVRGRKGDGGRDVCLANVLLS